MGKMEGALVMVRILPRLLNPFFDPEVITRIRSRPGNTKAGIGSFRLQIFPVGIFVTRPPEIGIFQVDCLIAKPNDPVGFEGEALRKFERVQER